jgi:uncharacterized protein (DUF934 family)
MLLVRNDRIVEDRFVRVRDDEPPPEGVPAIVPAARLLADAAALRARGIPVGVLWPNDRKVAELAPHLCWLALVGLVFPKFRDGRAYSQARLIRERHGFRGELRATGNVLRDQFLFMLRAGFDAFEVQKEADAHAFSDTVRRYSVFFQPSTDGRPTVFRRRLSGQHPADAPESRGSLAVAALP